MPDADHYCQQGTARHRDCVECVCQSRQYPDMQCELDPDHEGDHAYFGGLDIDFAILWTDSEALK